jgi:hypothetical protein
VVVVVVVAPTAEVEVLALPDNTIVLAESKQRRQEPWTTQQSSIRETLEDDWLGNTTAICAPATLLSTFAMMLPWMLMLVLDSDPHSQPELDLDLKARTVVPQGTMTGGNGMPVKCLWGFLNRFLPRKASSLTLRAGSSLSLQWFPQESHPSTPQCSP